MKKLISLQLDEKLIKRLKKYAFDNGATISGIIRLAIETYLEGHSETK